MNIEYQFDGSVWLSEDGNHIEIEVHDNGFNVYSVGVLLYYVHNENAKFLPIVDSMKELTLDKAEIMLNRIDRIISHANNKHDENV